MIHEWKGRIGLGDFVYSLCAQGSLCVQPVCTGLSLFKPVCRSLFVYSLCVQVLVTVYVYRSLFVYSLCVQVSLCLQHVCTGLSLVTVCVHRSLFGYSLSVQASLQSSALVS